MNGKWCKNAALWIETVCRKGVVLEQEGEYRDSSGFLARSEIIVLQAEAASTMISPLQERRAPSFRFLEFEQVDTVPGHGSKRSPACRATVCLGKGAPNGRLAHLRSAFQQPREVNTFPRGEELCWSGVAAERLDLIRLPVPRFCSRMQVLLATNGNASGAASRPSCMPPGCTAWLSRVYYSVQSRGALSDSHVCK